MKILILARMTTVFDGSTVEKQPLGGSESALLYLTRELAKLGHQIVIFNNCFSGEGVYAGVEYRHLAGRLDGIIRESWRNDYDIFIGFRDLAAFLYPIKAKKKIWWGHDDFSNVWQYPGPLKIIGWLSCRFCDRFFVVSNWLGQILEEKLGIPKDRIYATRNGIELKYFEDKKLKRYRHRLAYTSVPERGLDVLIDIFPKIRERVPECELHIFCGDELGILKEEDRIHRQVLYAKANRPGVIIRGTKSHPELAEELQQSYLWLYPVHGVKRPYSYCSYAETSCIAALEAQAAGTPVIAGRRGALPEAVKDGVTGILIHGDPYSEEYQKQFAQATIDLLKDEDKWARFSHAAREFIQSRYAWEMVAREWDKELMQL